MVSILALALLLAAPPPTGGSDVFSSLEVYDGVWTVNAEHPFSGGSSADHLVNRCTHGSAFFTCEQTVNGKPATLVVFTVSREAGKFDVDNIFPNGHCASDTDLYIKGDHWTFLSHGDPGKPSYRTENTFTGRDHIRFEQFRSDDGGKTWTKTNQGDEVRTKP